MSEPRLPSLADLDPDEALLVDQTCRRFEAAWKDWQGGVRPALEDWLVDVPAAVRPVLLCELLRLELDYRRKAGERPVLADYLGRFGADEGLLRRELSELGKKTVPAPGHSGPGRRTRCCPGITSTSRRGASIWRRNRPAACCSDK